jgi:hypothetical protein
MENKVLLGGEGGLLQSLSQHSSNAQTLVTSLHANTHTLYPKENKAFRPLSQNSTETKETKWTLNEPLIQTNKHTYTHMHYIPRKTKLSGPSPETAVTQKQNSGPLNGPLIDTYIQTNKHTYTHTHALHTKENKAFRRPLSENSSEAKTK